MKPAPFENVDYVDPKTKFHVVSTMAGPNTTEGTTVVLDKSKKQLWKAAVFIGRFSPTLSSDGTFLLLSGEYWFGNRLNLNPKSVVAKVLEKGETIKVIYLSDLVSGEPEAIATQRKLPVMGGGWVALKDFVKKFEVDWSKRSLMIEMYDGSLKTFAF